MVVNKEKTLPGPDGVYYNPKSIENQEFVMSSAASTIQVSGLARGTLDALRAQAEAAGVPAEVYARQLLEEGISLEEEARTMTFDKLFSPVQKRFRKSGMEEKELDKLVDSARARHHGRVSRNKA